MLRITGISTVPSIPASLQSVGQLGQAKTQSGFKSILIRIYYVFVDVRMEHPTACMWFVL